MTSQQTITRRPANERGVADFGWLKSAHTFCFGQYYDQQHTNFGVLRVINDDEVAGGGGFPSHPHQDAEIFSYVLEGGLAHKDSMGNGSTVQAGGVQYMSAGSGVTHSEFNPSQTQRMRFLQVWLIPVEQGVQPRYDTLDINPADKRGKLKLFLSPDGRDGSLQTRAKANVFAATIDGDERIEHDLGTIQRAWVQVARGSVRLNDELLSAGDSAQLVEKLKAANEAATVVYHDLADTKLPHIDTTIRDAWAPEGERDASLDELATRSKSLVTDLQAADTIIIGSPMYNFSVPTTLKAWIDHVAIAGQTFRYTETGPQGLLEGKKAYLILSSGGIYSEGPAASSDHLDPYLRTVLAFMGITDVTTIRAEGVAYGPEQDKAAMQQASAQIQAL